MAYGKNFPKRDDNLSPGNNIDKRQPRPSSYIVLVVDGEHGAQAKPTGVVGI